MAFTGVHSDIGGGFVYRGGLSDDALRWMHDKMLNAHGLPMTSTYIDPTVNNTLTPPTVNSDPQWRKLGGFVDSQMDRPMIESTFPVPLKMRDFRADIDFSRVEGRAVGDPLPPHSYGYLTGALFESIQDSIYDDSRIVARALIALRNAPAPQGGAAAAAPVFGKPALPVFGGIWGTYAMIEQTLRLLTTRHLLAIEQAGRAI